MKKPARKQTNSSKKFTQQKQLKQQHIDLIASLKPNFDLDLAEDLFDQSVLPIFLYGTLSSGQPASDYLEDLLHVNSQRAVLHGHRLYVHSRQITIGQKTQDEYFPYAYREEWHMPVKGKAFLLKPQNNRGRKRMDIIKEVDEYEEVSSGLFERKVVSVEVSGELVYAVAYIGTDKLKSRSYITDVYPHKVHKFHEDSETHIESGDFASHNA